MKDEYRGQVAEESIDNKKDIAANGKNTQWNDCFHIKSDCNKQGRNIPDYINPCNITYIRSDIIDNPGNHILHPFLTYIFGYLLKQIKQKT